MTMTVIIIIVVLYCAFFSYNIYSFFFTTTSTCATTRSELSFKVAFPCLPSSFIPFLGYLKIIEISQGKSFWLDKGIFFFVLLFLAHKHTYMHTYIFIVFEWSKTKMHLLFS